MSTASILNTAEVARLFGVHPKTVSRWAESGKVPSFRTVGGHRRFKAVDVEKLWQQLKDEG
jgi:excisionase family DNA binding protein